MSTWRYIIYFYALIYAIIYLYMFLCKRKKRFIKITIYTNFISAVIDINFWRIWYFHMKGTGLVGLEPSIIFMQTEGRFDMWATLYTDILTLAMLKHFMSKDLSTKHYKVSLLLITQIDIQTWNKKYSLQRLNQICLYKPLIKRWIFDDSDEIAITLPLLKCLKILEYIWWLLNSDL